MHHNLIFFEGLTGSGKSTLSQWLAWRLAERGQVVRWCSEMSASHPFDDPDIKHDLLGDDFLKKAVEGWALAAQRMADFDGVWVLDCGPLQKTAMLALHLGLGVDLIEEALVQIGTQLSPLNPKMICFHQDSVCDQVRSIYQQRGERFCDALVEWTDRSAVPEARKGIEGSCDFGKAMHRFARNFHRPYVIKWKPSTAVLKTGMGNVGCSANCLVCQRNHLCHL